MSVPWKLISEDQDKFIKDYYLPDVHLQEPSKLIQSEVKAVLDFWYARQSENTTVFKFRRVSDSSGTMWSAKYQRHDAGKARKKGNKRKQWEDMDSDRGEPPVGSPKGKKRARHDRSQLSAIREDSEGEQAITEDHPVTKVGPPRGHKRTQDPTIRPRPKPKPRPRSNPRHTPAPQAAVVGRVTPDLWPPIHEHSPRHTPCPSPASVGRGKPANSPPTDELARAHSLHPSPPTGGRLTPDAWPPMNDDDDDGFDVPSGGHHHDPEEDEEHNFQAFGGPPSDTEGMVNQSLSSASLGKHQTI